MLQMGGIAGPENLEGSNRKRDLSAIGPQRPLPHSQQHTLSLAHTHTHFFSFPLSLTHSLFASVSLSHSFSGALLFHLSTVECRERWFSSLAGWLAGWHWLDWGKQRQSWGPEGRDSTERGFRQERSDARFPSAEIICITKPVERGLRHYTGCTTAVRTRGAI